MLEDQNESRSIARRTWHWLRWPAFVAAWLAAYLAVYGATRRVQRVRDERFEIQTGSRLSNWLFAPAIQGELSWRRQDTPNAEQVLADALLEARRTERNVLLAFGTRGCLPCRQLERFFDEQAAIIERYYVVRRIDVDDKMFRGLEILDRYRPFATDGGLRGVQYYPWQAILDADGTRIVMSDDGPPGVIGLAQGGPADRAWFLEMLRRGAGRISDAELGQLDAAAQAFRRKIVGG